jgi:hypothetical protein
MPKKTQLTVKKKQTEKGKHGAPKGATRALVHGARAEFTLRSLDGRTRLAKTWRALEAELIAALGGEPTPQERMLIGRVVFKMLKCHFYERGMLEGLGKPDSTQYLAYANSLRLDLAALGLSRRAKPVQDLEAYIAEAYPDDEENED